MEINYKELIEELSSLQKSTKKKINCKNDFLKWGRENKYDATMCERLITLALKENERYQLLFLQIQDMLSAESHNIENNKRINEIKSILKIG